MKGNNERGATFEGHICARNPAHGGERRASNGCCVQCTRDYAQQYRNDPVAKAAKKLWVADNPDKISEANHRYYWKDPDVRRSYAREYYAAHRIRVLQQVKERAAKKTTSS